MRRTFYRLTENRAVMYLLYTFVAAGFYYAAFNFTAFGTEIGLLIVAIAFLKDFLDTFLISKGQKPGFYRHVEHNPFNYVLVFFILVMGYSGNAEIIGLEVTRDALVVLATSEFVLDLYQDLEVERKIQSSPNM